MRIALLAHVRHPIAEPFMGGMEAHSWHLAAGLQARGHDVVLFASGDSDPRFAIDPVLREHFERIFPQQEHRENAALVAHGDAGFASACDRIARGGFEVCHNNSLHRFPLQRAQAGDIPTVTSLHVPPFKEIHGFVRNSVAASHRLTVTSAAQLQSWWPEGAPPEACVLHNGIDPAAWPFQERGNGTAVWCGRITPNKGTHLAVAAARRAGVALTLFGSIEDPGYWRDAVAPGLGDSVRYGGHLHKRELAAEFGRASVFLFTPCWDEPFGLVAIEAMSCGLPIAGIDNGAAREVISHAGILVRPDDPNALAHAITKALMIDREIPRQNVISRFTRDRWLDHCERLYADVRAGGLRTGQGS